MKKPLVSVLLSGAMLLTAGVAGSWAGTITFDNSSIHPEGSVSISIGDTLPLANEIVDAVDRLLPLGGFENCSSQDSIGCLSATNDVPTDPLTTPSINYAYLGGVINMPGPAVLPEPTGAPDPIAEVIEAFNEACETRCGGGANFSVPANDLLGDAPIEIAPLAGAAVDPAAAPESGSLILVGLGLIAGANYLRRRKLA